MQSCLGYSGKQRSDRFQFASSNGDMNAYASFVVLLLLLSSSRATTSVETQATGTPKEPFYEPECLGHGGICMEREKCPPEKLSDVAALCPKQQDQGIDCCFGNRTDVEPFYVEECVRMGGKCMAKQNCPRGSLADIKGMCSKTSGLAIECCLSREEVKLKRRRLDLNIPWQCSAIGGKCREECSPDEYQYWTADCDTCCVARDEDD